MKKCLSFCHDKLNKKIKNKWKRDKKGCNMDRNFCSKIILLARQIKWRKKEESKAGSSICKNSINK